MSDIRICGIENDSIVDGPGIRFTVFSQGCPHNCPGCHNPQSHDPKGGYLISETEILDKIKANPLLDGVTFSGGEPFLQAKAFSELAKKIHALGLDIITYTGYTYEEILSNAEFMPLLLQSDIIVDGRFEIDKKSIDLRFKGSSNQRVIDVKKSLANGRAVLSEYN
ncbi:MAG: anaerobic ribonucleoside-triphosphate reductase activating protein [Clostridiales bacterium]|nr:anaerobic ribonucleoside-triphosphate reductase activating protein [Clostridiales bacterium]